MKVSILLPLLLCVAVVEVARVPLHEKDDPDLDSHPLNTNHLDSKVTKDVDHEDPKPELGIGKGSSRRGRILENPDCKKEIPSRCEGNREPSTDLEALDCILNHKVNSQSIFWIA
jgi:hypothetical protein